MDQYYASCYYKCKHSRRVATGKCAASLSLQVDVNGKEDLSLATHESNTRYQLNGNHTCGQDSKSVVGSSGIVDYRPVMENEVRKKATQYGMSKPIQTIAVEVYDEFNANKSTMATLSTVNHMKDIIKTMRQEESSSELAIYQSPAFHCSDTDQRPILQFDLRYITPNQKDQPLQRAIGWAHPDIINLVKHGPVALFCDATFRAAVKGFLQCLIIMVYLRAVDMFVPIWYTLMTCKDEDSYGRVFEAMHCSKF